MVNGKSLSRTDALVSMLRKHSTTIVLLLITFLAFFFRFCKLLELPFPPDGDELAFGYYGWSLLKFGTDEYGNLLPFHFLSIGDFKYPGLAYLNMIPALFFGLGEVTARFWSALSGVLLVPVTFLITNLLFSNKRLSWLTALFIAVSPWGILESRLGYENMVGLTIGALGFACLVFAMEGKKIKAWKISIDPAKSKNVLVFAAALLFAVSTFVYAAQRVFIPLMLIALISMSFLDKDLKKLRKGLFVAFLTVVLVIALSLIPETGRGRAAEESWKGITGDQRVRQALLHVGAGISPVRVPVYFTRVMHNKYRIALYDLARNYADHFSPDFLFFKGEEAKEKIPDTGVLLFAELLFLPLGLVTMLRRRTSYREGFIFSWLLAAPVASTLTFGGAHIHRSSAMIVPVAMFSAYGFYVLTTSFSKKINTAAALVLSAALLFSFLYAMNQLFVQKPVDNPWRKEQVYKEVVLDVLKLSKDYEAVVVEDDDYIYFLFYGQVSPHEFTDRSDITPYTFETRWERVNRFGKFVFKMPFDCPKSGKLNVLYVCSGARIPRNSTVLKTYYYLDGVPAYNLIEFHPFSEMKNPLPELSDKLHYMVDIETREDLPEGIIPGHYEAYW